MAGIPKEHMELYFDKLCRTQKAETVLSLIQATYHSKKSSKINDDVKTEIARRLQSAYDLFRDNIKGTSSGAGTYNGAYKQFESQYTIGHELCIWKNSSLDLTILAEEVAKNNITIKDYFDIFFYNYFQPINGKAVHPLYQILKYMLVNGVAEIEKEWLPSILNVTATNENINALCNFLDGTNYIEYDGSSLKYVGKLPIDKIIKKCNIRYIGENGLALAKTELDIDEKYAEYITTEINIDEEEGNNEIELSNEKVEVQLFSFKESPITDGQNLIVYGTPGCGKSYYVEHTLLDGYPKDNYIRTTFYQDYTNTDFVGQILPVVEGDKVTYKFNPGPFTLALEQAIRKPNERIALVIEELNRGSAASIFGDIFQLLDRKEGVSEYGITNVNIINYLKEKFEGVYTFKEIRLPGNLSIYATMNTSDQNVFTLDTAFKRRWKFKKLINEFAKDHKFKDKYIPGADITWEELVNDINEYILECSSGLNSEDKQLGVYFVDENGMRKEKVDASDPEAVNAFAYKVLEYLWSDVAKFDRNKWFADGIKSLDELVKEYKEKGLEVFVDGIFNK